MSERSYHGATSRSFFGWVQSFCWNKGKIYFGGRDVMESFRFHPTLTLFYLKECQFYNLISFDLYISDKLFLHSSLHCVYNLVIFNIYIFDYFLKVNTICLTPKSRFYFCAGVSLNIHPLIHWKPLPPVGPKYIQWGSETTLLKLVSTNQNDSNRIQLEIWKILRSVFVRLRVIYEWCGKQSNILNIKCVECVVKYSA